MNTRFSLSLAAVLVAGAASSASGGLFTVTRIDNDTALEIKGTPGDSFSVTAPNPKPPPPSITLTGSTNVSGQLVFGPISTAPKTATVTNLTEPAVPAVVADLFTPGLNLVVSDYSIASGSNLMSGGNTFAISGKYTTVDTNVDYDPSSPTYGTETGFLDTLNIQAAGSAGIVQFNLASNPIYSVNLASIWGQIIPASGLSVPIDVSFGGMLSFDSVPSPFIGTFDGFDIFFPDGSTTDQGTLSFNTDFGVFTGTLTASSQPVLVTVEPSTGLLVSTGAFTVFAIGWRRRHQVR